MTLEAYRIIAAILFLYMFFRLLDPRLPGRGNHDD